MVQTIAESQVAAALRAAEDPDASPDERAEMLMEIAMGLQMKPRLAQQLHDAVALYDRALAEQPHPLLAARIRSRMGTALQSLPDGGSAELARARDCYEQAIAVLREHGKPTETAEAELNLGLATQALCAVGAGRIQDAIQCYHRALRVFGRDEYPQEFAVLHNNLAIAYLAIPASDERARMREALAVQSFEEVLRVVNLIDHPSEYAMIQNNLGNALQYAASGHPLENNLRALTAYDEALKVRNARDTPVEYANTIANKANVLRSLPPDADWGAQRDAKSEALSLYAEACDIFERHDLRDRAQLMKGALMEITLERTQRQACDPDASHGAGSGAGNGVTTQ